MNSAMGLHFVKGLLKLKLSVLLYEIYIHKYICIGFCASKQHTVYEIECAFTITMHFLALKAVTLK